MKLVIILVVQEDYDKEKEDFSNYLKRIRAKYAKLNDTNRVIIIA